MTATFTPRAGWARRAAAVTGLLTLPALAAGCGSQAPADDSSGSGGSADAASGSAAPAVDPACPQGLTTQDLSHAVNYPSADVDGDGENDSISIGTVDGGDASCAAALVVTTAQGTAVAALPGLQIVPPRAFVPGGAAMVGSESVIAAPVSFSPRGGGAIGLFTLVDGVLTPLQDGSGKPWTIFATIDDGGGIPQSIDCGSGGLTHTLVLSDSLSGTFAVHEVSYSLDGTQLSKTGASNSNMSPRDPTRDGDAGGSGLSIFENC
jgi:hypothetical protein